MVHKHTVSDSSQHCASHGVVMNHSLTYLGVCGTWCLGVPVWLLAMFVTKCGSYPITVNWTQILICKILTFKRPLFFLPIWATIIYIVVGFCHAESFKPCIAVYFCTFLDPCYLLSTLCLSCIVVIIFLLLWYRHIFINGSYFSYFSNSLLMKFYLSITSYSKVPCTGFDNDCTVIS